MSVLIDFESCSDHEQGIWLSILIPVYNVAPYLTECLSSVATQLSRGDGIEVILVDDCSTDGSRELAARLCRDFGTAFRLILHDKNGGLSAARNTMIEHANGDYLWFVDSDDMLLDGAIKALRGVVLAHAPDVITCDYIYKKKYKSSFGGRKNQLVHCKDEALFQLFNSRKLYSWAKITRRELWASDLRFPVGKCFEDIATTPYLFLRAKSFFYVNKPWYFYRLRGDSITATASNTTIFNTEKNNDLAFALSGFPTSLQSALPKLTDKASYAIGHFVNKELLRIGKFRQSAVRANRVADRTLPKFGWYWQQAELCSPMTFKALASAHLRNGRLLRWLQIRRWQALAQRDLESEPANE